VRDIGQRLACYLCAGEATTRDHVPPRGFFNEVPNNIITIPACHQCNNSYAKDEEYFRTMVAAQCYDKSAAARQVWQGPVIRALWRKGYEGLRKRLLRKSMLIQLPPGRGLPIAAVFVVEGGRAARVVRKIVKGLYFALRDERLDDADLLIFLDQDVRLDFQNLTRTWQETDMGETFRCRWAFDDNGGAIWMQFYRASWWLAVMGDMARDYPRRETPG